MSVGRDAFTLQYVFSLGMGGEGAWVVDSFLSNTTVISIRIVTLQFWFAEFCDLFSVVSAGICKEDILLR